MIILDGKKTSNDLKDEIAIEVTKRKDEGKKIPHLAAILVGTDGASMTYVNSKVKACEKVGFNSTLIDLPEDTTEEQLLNEISDLNNDKDIDGFIVQLPLPKHIDEQKVLMAVDPDKDVDGFLFNYHHFFGDYDHYLPVHGWYKNEIRIVRNYSGIYSYKDAQSFRKNDNEKLNVVHIEPYVYHYGWVRPPHLMQSKKKEQDSMHHGKEKINEEYKSRPGEFDYGSLRRIPVFKGSHPKVMDDFRSKMNWKNKLNYSGKSMLNRDKMKHERFKYKVPTRGTPT